jgi:hypothetical protein
MVRQRSLQKGMAAVGLAASNCLSQIGQCITLSLSSFRWDWQRDLTNQQSWAETNSQPATNHVPYGKSFCRESRFPSPFSPQTNPRSAAPMAQTIDFGNRGHDPPNRAATWNR